MDNVLLINIKNKEVVNMFKRVIVIAVDLGLKLYKTNMYDLGEVSF